MSVSKLPSGRYRAQVYDPAVKHNVTVRSVLPDEPVSYKNVTEARRARARARAALGQRPAVAPAVTVADWQHTWTSERQWQRPKDSTNIHNHERIRAFCEAHADSPIREIGDEHVQAWLRGGSRNGQVPALRAFFNDASTALGGRLIDRNPFANLGIRKGPGRRDQQPPPEETVAELIAAARRITGASLSAWLQVAAYTGLRPAELDGLKWATIDWEHNRIHVVRQYSSKSRKLTLPKNGLIRQAPLTAMARAALLDARRAGDGDYCFPALRAPHWTASSRSSHWSSVRHAVGYDGDLYLATRHFAGWYMVNVLRLDSEDVAIALGHTDGGQLVRQLYGHRDRQDALDRVLEAHDEAGRVRSLDVARAQRRDETA